MSRITKSRHGQLGPTEHASNRTPRRINRNFVFNLVRRHQPISRAEIARRSGLRRSTVSIIVEDLLGSGWLIESAEVGSSRGRKPIPIRVNEARAVIALDIHPSLTSAAIADMSGRTEYQLVLPTVVGSESSLNEIVAMVKDLIHAHPERSFQGIGVCLPGRVDANSQNMVFAPRLNWPNMDVKTIMQQATGVTVECDNVANACALAEVWFGDSDPEEGIVAVNVAEGISVGMFLGQSVWRGFRGMAGEYGHVVLKEEGGVQCACGNKGCWETLASETAALRYHAKLAGDHAAPTYRLLVDLALGGQASAVEALKAAAQELARGIRILLSGLAAKEIVIIGEISRAWLLVGGLIHDEVHRGSKTAPTVLRAQSGGQDARLRGAVALVLGEGSIA